jgi:hypothetical protein
MVAIPTHESNPEGGGSGFSERCDCHFIIEGWEDFSGESNPRIGIDVVAVASTVESQVGRKRTERFSLHPKAAGRLLEFACAIGLYTKDQWKKDKETGNSPNIDFEQAVGRQFAAPIGMTKFDEAYWKKRLKECQTAGDTIGVEKAEEQLSKNSGKSFPQLGGDHGFTFWGLGDPEADHVPLSAVDADVFKGNLPTKNGTTRRRGDAPAGGAAKAATNTPPAGKPSGAASKYV